MINFDFGALPPEINSGRMYMGAGAGPLVSAAAAWDGLASELSSAAGSYQAAIADAFWPRMLVATNAISNARFAAITGGGTVALNAAS